MNAPHVVEAAEAFGGGVARQLAQIADALPALGWRATFLIGARPDEPSADARRLLAASGCAIETLPLMRRTLLRPDRDWAAGRDLERRLRRLAPDLVHTHAAKAGYLGRRAARRLGIPAIHTPHVFAFEWAPRPLSWLYAALERRAANRSGALVCLTPGQRADALKRGVAMSEASCALLPNGVDCEWFRPPTPGERAAARAAYALPAGARVAGHVGRFCRQKDMPTLLAAAAFHARADPAFHLLLVGTGPEVKRTWQAALALARAEGWPGRLRCAGETPDVREVYWALDALLLTSLWEGMPYGLLEALACGVPAAATATRGAAALVREGENGWLSDPGDARGMAAALGRWRDAAAVGRSAAFGLSARHTAERHNASDWARRLALLYDAVLQAAARRK